MKSKALFSLALIATASLALTTRGMVIKYIPSKGCPVPVETIDVSKVPAYEDITDFGSGEHNWGGPYSIGKAASGDSIYVGYDYNLLTHKVLIGDSLIAADISLIFSDVDTIANTAVISRGPHKRKKVNFADPKFPQIIRNFISPTPGFHKESYSFGMYSPDDESSFFIPNRRTYSAELPDDKDARRAMLRMLQEMYFDGGRVSADSDTIIYVDRDIDNLKDYAERSAEQLALSDTSNGINVTPLPPFTLENPMATFTDVVQFLPVCETPSYMTLMATVNSIYPAGGGRSSSTYYTSFAKNDSRPLSIDDLFEPKRLNDVKRAFVNAVSRQMIAENMIYSEEENVEELYSPAVILDAFITEVWSGTEKYLGFRTDINEMLLPELAAITPEGIIFSYPGDIFTMFGETGLFTQLVPWSEIKGALKSKVRKEVASLKPIG